MDITALAQVWVEHFLWEGDLAIDATVGNGHDTVRLARGVGATGTVFGFDLQAAALEATRKHLETEGLLDRVQLIHGSHAGMDKAVREADETRRARVIMFNLGYLPGGDKTVTTLVEETMAALEIARELLADGGVLTVVMYPGHAEGEKEARAIVEWGAALPGAYDVTVSRPLNRRSIAPFLMAVEKRPSASGR